jgi:hypothetical protein
MATAAAFASDHRLVLVVTHLRIIAEQWMERLTREGVTSLQLLARGSDLRLALSRGSEAWPDRGVIVATDAALTTGSIASKVHFRPDLLILDDADAISPAADRIQRLVRAAPQTLARVRGAIPSWLSNAQHISWAPDVVVPDRRDRYALDVVPYHVDASERRLITDAVAFLAHVAGELPPDAITRYGVQSRLEHLETASGADSDVDVRPAEDRIALEPEQHAHLEHLLDLFDDLGEDPRLEAMASTVRHAHRQQRPCVVVVEFLREMAYVVPYLCDAVPNANVQELTSRIPLDEISLVRGKLAAGGIVVASAGYIENGEGLPDRTVNIWWNSPRTDTQAQARLGVGFNSTGINVYALIADPPLTDRPLPSQAVIDRLTHRSR